MKYFIMMIVKFFMLFIISGCVVNAKSSLQIKQNQSKDQKKVEEYALYVQEDFEPKGDPCSDFDSYICGYWRPVIGTLGMIGSHVAINLNKLFEEYNSTIKTKFDAGSKAKLIYDTCRQYQQQESDYKQQKEILKKVGKFPAFETNWSSDNFDYIDVIINLASYKIQSLFEFKTVPSYSKPQEYVLWIAPIKLTSIDNESEGPASNPFDLSNEILSEILNFQREIIKTPFPLRKSIELNTKEITYRELKTRIPEFDWDKYFTGVFGDLFKDSDRLIVQDETYLNYTVNLFKRAETRVLANFLMSQFIDMYASIAYGYSASECIDFLRNNMPDIVNALYLQTDHHQLRELELSQLFSDLRDSFLDIVVQSDWIDEKTKAGVAAKISKLEPILGYHGNITKPDELDARYQDLNVDFNDFFHNIRAISERFNKLTMKNLKEQNKVLLPETFDPLEVNAGYMEGENRVIFYTGLAHENVYYPAYPKAVNFGGYGTFLAHELAHSVDPQCRLFDNQGYRHEWWSDSSVEAYKGRIDCLVDQYDTLLKSREVENPGLKTIQENFADNVGLRISLNAYKKWLEKNKGNQVVIENEKLPGLNFTETQLFFVAFAKFRCSSADYIPPYVSNGYSPSKYRTKGCLQNSNEFAEAFYCPVGSVYNPEKKCIVF